MVNYIFGIFDKLSKRYESIFSTTSKERALYDLQKGGIDTKHYDVAFLGEYDIVSGVIKANAPEFLLWDMCKDNLPCSEAK